ncbi:MAG TPA: hypothetical protein VFW98_10095 [Gemmatimonadaceae bacterium]|nr:hypothetical protein [Gemmatimonadaceae bacterium]
MRQWQTSPRARTFALIVALASATANDTLLASVAILYTEMGWHALFDSGKAVVANRVPFPTVAPRDAK